MARENDVSFEHCEDLIGELEFKLSDIQSHIKLLSNSTNSNSDFDIEIKDINNFSLTMYDKIIASMLILEKLRIILEKLEQSQNI